MEAVAGLILNATHTDLRSVAGLYPTIAHSVWQLSGQVAELGLCCAGVSWRLQHLPSGRSVLVLRFIRPPGSALGSPTHRTFYLCVCVDVLSWPPAAPCVLLPACMSSVASAQHPQSRCTVLTAGRGLRLQQHACFVALPPEQCANVSLSAVGHDF